MLQNRLKAGLIQKLLKLFTEVESVLALFKVDFKIFTFTFTQDCFV